MNFNQLVSNRYSVRNFSKKEVEDEKLNKVLEAARLAPSAANFQPFKIYVIKSEPLLSSVRECYHREWINAAPIILVMVGLHEVAWKRSSDTKDYTDIDTAIAIDHMTLQATDLGLGSCWVCNFNAVLCSHVLKLKPSEEPIALIPLGFPASDDIPVRKRKGLDELVVWL